MKRNVRLLCAGFGVVLGAGLGTVGVRKALRLPILPDFLRTASLPVGQCTWHAFGRAAEDGWAIRFDTNSGRHARLWWNKVQNACKTQTPTPGSILVLDAWPGNEYGHVAYVESVEPGGKTFTISHANFAVGQSSGVRQGVTIFRARATLVEKGVSLEGRAPLPLVGFLSPAP